MPRKHREEEKAETGEKPSISRERGRGITAWDREITSLTEALSAGESIQLTGTHGIARSLIVQGLLNRLAGPVILVLPDIKTRQRVARELSDTARLLSSSKATEPPLTFPSWEVIPYMAEWLHPRISSQRVSTLYSLLHPRSAAILTTPEALMNRLVRVEAFKKGFLTLVAGMSLDRDEFLQMLIERGYSHTVSTELPGDMSVRGGILDVFSPLEEAPVRIEFEGDEIASLRHFDPASQRTVRHVDQAVIGPVQEFYPPLPFTEVQKRLYALSLDRAGKQAVRRYLRALTVGDPLENRLWLSPYLFPLDADFFSYLPSDAPIVLWDAEECRANLAKAYEHTRTQYEKATASQPLLPDPDSLFVPYEILEERIVRHPLLNFGLAVTGTSRPMRIPSELEARNHEPSDRNRRPTSSWPIPVLVREALHLHHEGYEVWIAEPNEEKLRTLQEELAAKDLSLPVFPALASGPKGSASGGLLRKELRTGCLFPEIRLAVLTRSRPWRPVSRDAGKKEPGLHFTELTAFKDGDPLVHLDYGIGLYRGLKHMEVLGKQDEFLEMEYARGDKLLVPIDKLNQIQRYVGSGEAPPPLDILGSASWARRKAKLREDVARIARELLELYAMRKALKGYAFSRETEELTAFEAAFPYQETPDQRKAIEDIYRDMASDSPMDRLVCGDVGFGKTEVAMRAAFKAVMEGKQVAVLVPTTVLAEQHYVNFSERFSPYPVRVELLSRFRRPAQQKAVVQELAKGTVDIVIGTHRLLQKDVRFRDLGLLVIDEEHRFGVTHKELLKKLSNTVDVLTLTATPIPRTLQMSLSGFRDLSLINTPPRARLPIVTKIARFRKDLVAEGIEREHARGGQVFFVHNRVKTIAKVANLIQELVPSTIVEYAHGQMDEKTLERIMLAFMRHEIDVLVCTTIIESGVDIPNVNTLFVHHAEQFGLSTLYQLRGRIGRSDRQAYAYFLVPHRAILPREAIKRLQSLQEYTSLGSGFKLSMMDLNLRGGGDLLGRRQSGRIAEVGFELYTRIIEEEVKKLKGTWTEPKAPVDLKLPFPTLFPESYLPDMGLRLSFYRRLSQVETLREVDDVEVELKDRFGPLPEEAQNLLNAVRLKIRLAACGVSALHGKKGEFTLSFEEDCPIDHQRLVTLLQSDPGHYRLTPAQKLVIRTDLPDSFREYAEKVLATLKQWVSCDKFSNRERREQQKGRKARA